MEHYYYSIASSSSGNCALLVQNGVRLLIDVGVSLRGLSQALRQLDLSPEQLSGVVLTHEHSDHVKGLAMLLKKSDVPVYASWGTAQALQEKGPLPRALQTFDAGERLTIGHVEIDTFPTPHDARESVGFVVSDGASRLGFATDLGFMPQTILERLIGCQTVVLESNHDENMLLSGPYPYPLKKRILGQRGHLSNAACAQSAWQLLQSGTRRVILAHLSQQNNTPRLAAQTVMDYAHRQGEELTYGGRVRVAPVQCAPVRYELEEVAPC